MQICTNPKVGTLVQSSCLMRRERFFRFSFIVIDAICFKRMNSYKYYCFYEFILTNIKESNLNKIPKREINDGS